MTELVSNQRLLGCPTMSVRWGIYIYIKDPLQLVTGSVGHSVVVVVSSF